MAIEYSIIPTPTGLYLYKANIKALFRPMAVPHLWGTRTSEYVKVGVVVVIQYGCTPSKLLATVLLIFASCFCMCSNYKQTKHSNNSIMTITA